MLVQGFGRANFHESKVAKRESPKPQSNNNGRTETKSFNAVLSERVDLLNKIKNRVHNGFYNSESVLDDLSHGIAKALDQTV